jgi:hypothetical protein
MASSYVANTMEVLVLATMAIHNQTKANISVKLLRKLRYRPTGLAQVTSEVNKTL